MKRKTITSGPMNTILWNSSMIVDWTQGGSSYDLEGNFTRGNFAYVAYRFDAAVSSIDHKFVLIYERLGTKALLLKDGVLIRELNRSYYQAGVTEYPITFYTNSKGITHIIHCPKEYNRLEIEIAETGKIITDSPDRNPDDFFHSRLEVSPSGKYLLSKGWIWHPLDYVCAFDLEQCIANPKLLDSIDLAPPLKEELDYSTATFLENDLAVLGSYGSDLNNTTDSFVVVWDIANDKLIRKIPIDGEIGNFIGISGNKVVDVYKYLKLVDLDTGTVSILDGTTLLSSQRSAIVYSQELVPFMIYNKEIQAVAARDNEKIEIFQLT